MVFLITIIDFLWSQSIYKIHDMLVELCVYLPMIGKWSISLLRSIFNPLDKCFHCLSSAQWNSASLNDTVVLKSDA